MLAQQGRSDYPGDQTVSRNEYRISRRRFHLFPYDRDYISKVAQRIKDDLGVRRVAPAHCTGNLAFKIFRELYGENYNYAGVEAEVMFPH